MIAFCLVLWPVVRRSTLRASAGEGVRSRAGACFACPRCHSAWGRAGKRRRSRQGVAVWWRVIGARVCVVVGWATLAWALQLVAHFAPVAPLASVRAHCSWSCHVMMRTSPLPALPCVLLAAWLFASPCGYGSCPGDTAGTVGHDAARCVRQPPRHILRCLQHVSRVSPRIRAAVPQPPCGALSNTWRPSQYRQPAAQRHAYSTRAFTTLASSPPRSAPASPPVPSAPFPPPRPPFSGSLGPRPVHEGSGASSGALPGQRSRGLVGSALAACAACLGEWRPV